MAYQNINNKVEPDNFIYTDTYRTKEFIWEAYYGFKENYNEYRHYIKQGKHKAGAVAGMNRYGFDLYLQIRSFCDSLKAIKPDLPEIDSLMKKLDTKELNSNEWFKIRLFFETFMNVSGIKNIIKEKEFYVAANNEI